MHPGGCRTVHRATGQAPAFLSCHPVHTHTQLGKCLKHRLRSEAQGHEGRGGSPICRPSSACQGRWVAGARPGRGCKLWARLALQSGRTPPCPRIHAGLALGHHGASHAGWDLITAWSLPSPHTYWWPQKSRPHWERPAPACSRLALALPCIHGDRDMPAGSPAGASSCFCTQDACTERPLHTHTGVAPGLWSP